MDNYLNELIDCSYSIVDDIPDKEIAREEEEKKLSTKSQTLLLHNQNQNQTNQQQLKVKPTTVNTSSKNLTIKPASTPPQPAVVITEK